jgi:hypothetical protein
MNIEDMTQGRFIKRSDVNGQGRGVVVTIEGLALVNCAMETEPLDEKWCAVLREFPDKYWVLNRINRVAIAQILASDETDDWIGRQVLLVDDPTVQFKGKTTGGIRVKPVSKKHRSAPTPTPEADDPGDGADDPDDSETFS